MVSFVGCQMSLAIKIKKDGSRCLLVQSEKCPPLFTSCDSGLNDFFATNHRQLTTDTISLDIGGYYGIYGDLGMV